jgi:hypothetical protein
LSPDAVISCAPALGGCDARDRSYFGDPVRLHPGPGDLGIGALVASSAWMLLQLVGPRQESRAPKRKTKQGPRPICRATIAEYVMTSPVLLTTEVELATGLGLDISPDVQDWAWAEEKARAFGIKDTTMLDQLLRENEQPIFRLASRFRWDDFHRGDSLRLLFQVLQGAHARPR